MIKNIVCRFSLLTNYLDSIGQLLYVYYREMTPLEQIALIKIQRNWRGTWVRKMTQARTPGQFSLFYYIICLFYSRSPLYIRPHILQYKSILMLGMVSFGGNNLVIFYYLISSETWPDTRLACDGRGLMRGELLYTRSKNNKYSNFRN